ncbi:MAG: SAM-dependent DNA methyltransferase [Collinsella aerofaciens]|nr:SAM-dependent DNA methyltransferase [Collinsella aerofaciens]
MVTVPLREIVCEGAADVDKQIKSRERVVDHGEVFTNGREVNAMLDMVEGECERIDSRFLEPACGDGNFLAEVLRRKLEVVRKRYGGSPIDYERHAFVAASSLYGVDLLSDNAAACRKRLFEQFSGEYAKVAKGRANTAFLDTIRVVINMNILCGNALSMRLVDENQVDTDEPIIFSEWSLAMGDKVKRRDFRLDELLEGQRQQMSLFGSSGSPASKWEYDESIKAYIPLPIQEYPLTSMYQIGAAA